MSDDHKQIETNPASEGIAAAKEENANRRISKHIEDLRLLQSQIAAIGGKSLARMIAEESGLLVDKIEEQISEATCAIEAYGLWIKSLELEKKALSHRNAVLEQSHNRRLELHAGSKFSIVVLGDDRFPGDRVVVYGEITRQDPESDGDPGSFGTLRLNFKRSDFSLFSTTTYEHATNISAHFERLVPDNERK